MPSDTMVTWEEFRALETCPRQYLFCARGPAAVRTAAGPGAVTAAGTRGSQRRELLAKVAGSIVQGFYRAALWSQPPETCADFGEAEIRAELSRARAGFWVLDPWDLDRMEETGVQEARAAAAGFQRTCGRWVLAGPRIEPRRVVAAPIAPGSPVVLVSRPHLYLCREDGEHWLLSPSFRREVWDPKTQQYLFPREEREALAWDVLVSYLATAKVPDRAGVLPLRYPAGYRWDAELDQVRLRLTRDLKPRTAADKRAAASFLAGRLESPGILWERCGLDVLEALAQRAASEVRWCLDLAFPARLGKWCGECAFQSQCGDRAASVQARRRVRRGMRQVIPAGSKVVRLGE